VLAKHQPLGAVLPKIEFTQAKDEDKTLKPLD
jgi:hypothetical protein